MRSVQKLKCCTQPVHLRRIDSTAHSRCTSGIDCACVHIRMRICVDECVSWEPEATDTCGARARAIVDGRLKPALETTGPHCHVRSVWLSPT